MTLNDLLQSIPVDLLNGGPRRAREREQWCLARGHRPTYAHLHQERARRKAAGR